MTCCRSWLRARLTPEATSCIPRAEMRGGVMRRPWPSVAMGRTPSSRWPVMLAEGRRRRPLVGGAGPGRDGRPAGAVPPARGALSDPDPDVRACAALALGRIGDGCRGSRSGCPPGRRERLCGQHRRRCLEHDRRTGRDSPGRDAGGRERPCPAAGCAGLGPHQVSERHRSSLWRARGSSYLVRYYAQEALESAGRGMVFVTP